MRYRGATIDPTPTEKFPKMVEITKGTKKVKDLVSKRYIDEHRAIATVDAYLAETFIEKTKIKAYKDALTVSGADVDVE
jgi:hypothetical protein